MPKQQEQQKSAADQTDANQPPKEGQTEAAKKADCQEGCDKQDNTCQKHGQKAKEANNGQQQEQNSQQS